MKKSNMHILCVIVLTTLTIALSGCAGDKEDTKASSSEITIGIPQDLDSLDPHLAVAAGTKEILFNLFEGLVKPDSEGNLIPAVASVVTPSEDGKVYTFTLRNDVKFHDGSTVTVEDVKYSIERCADTSTGSSLVPAFSNIETVETKDAETIVITLKEADTDFLAYMTTAIIPKDKEVGQNPIGTGPYKFESWSLQEEVVMNRFDDYWGEKADIETVTCKVIADADSIVTQLNGGAIDMFSRLTSAQVDQLSNEYQIYEGTMNLVQALYLNNKSELFKDIRVRQAVCYALDPQGILDMISDGKGEVIGSSMFPAFAKYYDESLSNTYQHNIEKAKELLAEAGYKDGISFTVSVPSNYQQHIDTAQVLVEQLKAAGIEANIQLIEWDSWLNDVYTNRQYDATVVGVDASSLTASALLARFQSEASDNFIEYQSDAYDEAFAQAKATTNDAEQTKLYKQCLEILNKDAANAYIQDLPEFVALNKNFTGYEFYPLYVLDFSKIKRVQE